MRKKGNKTIEKAIVLWILSVCDFFRLVPLVNRIVRSCYYLCHIQDQQKNARLRKRGGDDLPLPPLNLIYLTSAYYDLEKYCNGGHAGFQYIIEILEKNGYDISSFSAILDFGCGCGRVTRHWKSIDCTRIYGVDINQQCISWCSNHLDFATFKKNDRLPPLDFSDDMFDCIYAISVFTHLDEEAQLRWMTEFKRLLKKNGVLILTVRTSLGDFHPVSSDEEKQFHKGDMLIKYRKYVGTNFCNVFHPLTYIQQKLSKGFTILDIKHDEAEGFRQDFIVLKKIQT